MAERKESYQRPLLKIIELKLDEVLGVGCKTSTGSPGPTGPMCAPSGCAENGS